MILNVFDVDDARTIIARLYADFRQQRSTKQIEISSNRHPKQPNRQRQHVFKHGNGGVAGVAHFEQESDDRGNGGEHKQHTFRMRTCQYPHTTARQCTSVAQLHSTDTARHLSLQPRMRQLIDHVQKEENVGEILMGGIM